jgi:FkbM family methyltransferase
MSDFAIHTFDNGVRVYDAHLLEVQRARYRLRNVHEAEEEDIFISALADLPQGGLFLNVGAAIGYYAILAKLRRPDLAVHAVEALPSQAERFRQTVTLNGLATSAIQLHEVAVAPNDDVEAFLLDDSYGSRLLASHEHTHSKTVRVKAVPLAQLCSDIGGSIALLQMDIQGLEKPVLEKFFAGKSRPIVSKFLIGTHGNDIHQAVKRMLETNGYSIAFDSPQPKDQPDGILFAQLR